MLPYSYRNICVYIKKLVDSGCVSLVGVGNSKSYSLLSGGRKILSAYSPQRYTPELFELNKILARNPSRSRLRGDVAVMLSLAGFAVHPDDKPMLPAFTPQPPDCQYALRSLYQNYEPQQYGQIIRGRAIYTKHLTPVNCYYDSIQVKELRPAGAANGVNYSRACGVLLTPANLFRVYHSRDVAMRFHKTGEKSYSALLSATFTGYLPDDKSGILVFGWDFISASSILGNYLRENVIPRPKRGDGDILGTTNLGNPLFYLPLRSEAIEFLRLMSFPDWRKSLMYFASMSHANISQTGWSYQHEGRRVCIFADLNLTNIAGVLRGMMKNPREPVTLICLAWQQEFILNLVQEYSVGKADVRLVSLPDDFINDLINNHLKPHWG